MTIIIQNEPNMKRILRMKNVQNSGTSLLAEETKSKVDTIGQRN
jgi:hypothetical protein